MDTFEVACRWTTETIGGRCSDAQAARCNGGELFMERLGGEVPGSGSACCTPKGTRIPKPAIISIDRHADGSAKGRSPSKRHAVGRIANCNAWTDEHARGILGGSPQRVRCPHRRGASHRRPRRCTRTRDCRRTNKPHESRRCTAPVVKFAPPSSAIRTGRCARRRVCDPRAPTPQGWHGMATCTADFPLTVPQTHPDEEDSTP